MGLRIRSEQLENSLFWVGYLAGNAVNNNCMNLLEALGWRRSSSVQATTQVATSPNDGNLENAALKNSDIIYCLIAHAPGMEEQVANQIVKAIEDREIKKLRFLVEAVGGTLEKRERVEKRMSSICDGLQVAEDIGWPEAAGMVGRSVMRTLQLHVPIEFKLVDIDSSHPQAGYDTEEEAASKHYRDIMTSSVGQFVEKVPSQALQEQCLYDMSARRIRAMAEQVNIRNEVVKQQVRLACAADEEGTVSVVMVGAGHVAQARGMQKVLATIPEALLDRMPPRYRSSLGMELFSSTLRKSAEGLPLTRQDTRDEILANVTRHLLEVAYPELEKRFSEAGPEIIAGVIISSLPEHEREELFRVAVSRLSGTWDKSALLTVRAALGTTIKKWLLDELTKQTPTLPPYIVVIFEEIGEARKAARK